MKSLYFENTRSRVSVGGPVMVDMSATSTRAARIPRGHRRGLAERVAIWVIARSEHRRAEELEQIGWDLEAGCGRHAEARAERDPDALLPPGRRLL